MVLAIVSLCAALAPARGQAQDVLASIKALRCRRIPEGAVRVSYRVDGALGPQVRKNLESGIPVTFVHKLSVMRRRALFFDKLLVRETIEATATLDTLTRRYTLTRKVNELPPETATTDRAAEADRWLTVVGEHVIALPEDANKGSLELRVKTEYETNYYLLWVVPWSLSAIDSKECR